MLNPTALILAEGAQRNLFESGRLDGPSVEPGVSDRDARTTPVRRSRRLMVGRLRPAV